MTIKFEYMNSTIEFGAMHVPNRKRRALVMAERGVINVLGYFRDDDCADAFDVMLARIVTNFESATQARALKDADLEPNPDVVAPELDVLTHGEALSKKEADAE